MRNSFAVLTLAGLSLVTGCGGKDSTPDPVTPPVVTPTPVAPAMKVLGAGVSADRYTTEIATAGHYAYTGTEGYRKTGDLPSPVVQIWDVAASTPVLVDSLVISDAVTVSDVQVSDDGALLVVGTEYNPGSIAIYSLSDPRSPRLLTRYASANTVRGVHTAKLARVNGRQYAFLGTDPMDGENTQANPTSKLVILDMADPSAPVEVFSKNMGFPISHDVFVRDGLLFTALFYDGLTIWDIGGGDKGGSVTNPVKISNIVTQRARVHNVWWFHDPVTGSKRFAFVGEESNPLIIGVVATGSIHVVDLANMSAPVEVAQFTITGAGAHNFSVDEPNGILYSAFYNGGVVALDIRGDLSKCGSDEFVNNFCDLTKMHRFLAQGLQGGAPVFVWGVKYDGAAVYASDMLNGIWKLAPVAR